MELINVMMASQQFLSPVESLISGRVYYLQQSASRKQAESQQRAECRASFNVEINFLVMNSYFSVRAYGHFSG